MLHLSYSGWLPKDLCFHPSKQSTQLVEEPVRDIFARHKADINHCYPAKALLPTTSSPNSHWLEMPFMSIYSGAFWQADRDAKDHSVGPSMDLNCNLLGTLQFIFVVTWNLYVILSNWTLQFILSFTAPCVQDIQMWTCESYCCITIT